MSLLKSTPAVVPSIRECAEPVLPLPSDLAVRVRGWLDVAECARLVEGVYAAREHWVEAVSYTHLTLPTTPYV